MRSGCSAALLIAAAVACGCGDGQDSERNEFDTLESALHALSAALEGDWLERLDDVKRLSIASPRVAAARDTCAAAYEAFGEATVRLKAARVDVGRLEASLRGTADAGTADLGGLHARAMAATADVTAALDTAEALVRKCETDRNALRAALAEGR
jgi:hypothetical protein